MAEQAKNSSVAIIGAGLAGLSCARVLKDRGLRVSVFEKSRGPGGRMSTRRLAYENSVSDSPVSESIFSERIAQGSSPANDTAITSHGSTANSQTQWQCDHGAQYFTARHPLFVEQVAQWQADGVVAPWQPRLATIGQRPAVPHTEGVKTHRYVGIPRMTAPARQLSEGIDVYTGTRIVAVERTTEGWMLTQENETKPVGPFCYLVLALPAQQAGDLLASAAGPLATEPAQTYCRKLALRPCWALMLHFRPDQHTHDQTGCDYDAAFINPGSGLNNPDQSDIASWITRDSSKPGRLHQMGDTWLLHATPLWSEQHLESDEQLVYSSLLAAFRLLTGIQTAVSAFSVHRWRFAQTGNTNDCPGQLWLPDNGLGLCGDWLNGGRVEGAWLSGYQLAQQILSAR